VTPFNSPAGYGSLTKALHWLIAVLFAFQLGAGLVMTRTAPESTTLGLGQADWYNWHKSVGLLALLVAILRLVNRRVGELPQWAPGLVDWEKRFIHRAEQLMYLGMLVMPVSGFVYVMAGGYGVHFLGLWHLPNPLGHAPILARLAGSVHVAGGVLLYAAILAHVGIVLRHQLVLGDGLLWRMLPRRWQPPSG
jgi:cytochrome b561